MNENDAEDRPNDEHTRQTSPPIRTRKSPHPLSETLTRPASPIATATAIATIAHSPPRDIEQQGKGKITTDEARAHTQFTEPSQSEAATAKTSMGLSHIGNMLHSAHAQDFERRRKPTSLSSIRGGASVDDDDSDDDDDDDDLNEHNDIEAAAAAAAAAAAKEEEDGIDIENAERVNGTERRRSRRRDVDLEGIEFAERRSM